MDSDCSSVAGSGVCEPAVPSDVQDSGTKTINWLMHMNDGIDEVVTAVLPDCSPAGDVEAQPSSADVTVAPDAVSEDALASLECADQLPALEAAAESAVSMSPALPEHLTDTQPPTHTQDHVVCVQPPALNTRLGRPVRPPARLICEVNEQVVDDSASTVDSLCSELKF